MLMTHAILQNCVFIDECGYNVGTARSHGRARLGERAYRQVCGQRGQRLLSSIGKWWLSVSHGLSRRNES